MKTLVAGRRVNGEKQIEEGRLTKRGGKERETIFREERERESARAREGASKRGRCARERSFRERERVQHSPHF